MTSANYIVFNCFEVQQPIGTFYVGIIASADLIKIAYSDIRRIEKRDVEKYLGIEREISPQRVKEIKEYVNNVDATFPTSIILAVDSDCRRCPVFPSLSIVMFASLEYFQIL